ncbi:MAG: redoxin domain-containing protein [Polyangiales bacterium]
MRRIVALSFLLLSACHRDAPTAGKPPPTQASTAAPEVVVAPSHAEIGKLAPDFELDDLDGKTVKLSSFRGKIVVLEWFNPGCPFVKIAHRYGGSLETMAKREAQNGVVWLAINSGAPGKQGHGKDANLAATKAWDLQHPILLDEKGTVGKTYGATNTPHMFVIDANGTLVYAGAIDDTRGGELEPGETKVNYVEQALAAVRAGKPVATAETKAWGCGVKYTN